ncbi:MAG: hypothetical protein JWO36_1445 [Myxococcales bacterium]|nr:hypothetical protein [Myxococcales bacterium]
MRARGCLVVGVLMGLTAIASGDPKPTPVDLKLVKDKLLVFQDAQGGTYVVLPGDEPAVFYGTAKVLYKQTVVGRSANGDAWTINTWAPRVPDLHPAQIERKADGTFERSCGGADDVGLTQITGDKAKQVIEKSSFLSPVLMRIPYLLARDEAGIYYYVDRFGSKLGGKGFRVFVGKKGAMKAMPLTDVATDSAGDVFSTKTGDLRFVRTSEDSKTTMSWVRGEKTTKLINLDLDVNSPLIFRDLGIYGFTGTLCENI